VTNLARAGHSVDKIVYRVTMDKCRSWFGYDKYVEANVRAMYQRVSLNRWGNPRSRR